jgi:HK97 family phage major capsid protein
VAGVYNEGIFRTGTYGGGTGPDPLVPEPVSTQIIQELPQQSLLLQRAASVPMSAKTDRLPVLDVLPVAYWVGSDTGLEQTTQQEWKNVQLVAEELAAIVPIPNTYLDDTDVPIWDQVRPRLAAACGKLIDQAGIWGVGTPSTWSTPLYTAAVAAGNVIQGGSGRDAGVDVTQLGEQIAEDGYSIDGWAARPGYTWKLTGMRAGGNSPTDGGSGVPIWQPDMKAGVQAGLLYGYPLSEVKNGSWQTGTDLIGGDWTKAILGLRADMSYTMFTEGVISDDTGKVVLNLMQQNAVALRVVMRVGFATANPVTELNSNGSTRYPFGVLKTPVAAS